MLDALLGNVFAHTPDGTEFRVVVKSLPGGGGRLTVADAGPGPGKAGSSGSTGLGLDIVGRTAEASGGRLQLGRSDLGGLRADATFGAPLT